MSKKKTNKYVAVGGQALHEVGVFFFGHTGLDDVGAVGRVVAFGQ